MSRRSVNVSGYYRSNGTYVSGYTRSAPSHGSSSSYSCSSSGYSSSSGAGSVSVSGYYRSNGTYVSGYTRSSPKSSSSSSSTSSRSSSQSPAATVHVSGYTRADGTQVSGYTRAAPISKSGSETTSSKLRSASKSIDTVTVSGTKAAPKLNSGTQAKRTGGATGQKCYVDNAYNRKLGRVGKPLGTYIVHKDGGQSISATPIVTKRGHRAKKQDELVEKFTVEDLAHFLGDMGFTPAEQSIRADCQNAMYMLEREAVQERWSRSGISPATDIAALPRIDTARKIIPFGELELDKVVGRGGFGEVFAGLWHQTPIAYKKLLLQRLSKKRKESFEIEITVLASLAHPNIVRMFGVVNEEGNCGIVMEYLIRTLYKAVFMDETKFLQEKKKSIVHQMVSALAYLHAYKDKTIAHGDLKSENILLDKDDNARLADFGLSALKNATDTSRSSAVDGVIPGQGTPRYSAPEVLRGEVLTMKQLLQADIYSLGVTMFELLAEEEAYEDLSLRQLEANVGRGKMRPPTDKFSKPVACLLNHCWEENAKDRPTAQNIVDEWKSISDLY